MKVLLIEDDAATVKAIRLCFKTHRPDVAMVAATKGLKAIKLFSSEAPDMVIIDNLGYLISKLNYAGNSIWSKK